MKIINNLRRAIRNHVEAENDLTWKGSQDPETWDDIDRRSEHCKKHLNKVIKQLRDELKQTGL